MKRRPVKVKDEPGSIEVVIRPRFSGFALLLLLILLFGSAYFLFVMGVAAVSGGATSFMAIMSPVLLMCVAGAVFLIGWMAAGREVIRADADGITHRLEVLGLGSRTWYPASEIAQFSVRPEDAVEHSRHDRLKGAGPLFFEHQGVPIRLGGGLTVEEAREIAERVRRVSSLK